MPVSWHPMQLASCKRFPSALSPGNSAASALSISRANSDTPRMLFMVASDVGHAERNARCFYYFFMVVVIRYKTKVTACRALTFVVRIFVDDTIAIAVWTSFDTITIALWISFHLCVPRAVAGPCTYKDIS